MRIKAATMQNSFISLMTKAVKNWKVKDGKGKADKMRIAQLNYYDAVSTPDTSSNSQVTCDKTALLKSSIKDEMSAFFLETSFTALTQIYKANSMWKRVVWTVLVIGMLAWMAVQCYWLLDKYYSYPIEVKMDLRVSTVLVFPSVTICNLNPIMEPKVVYEPYTPLKKYADPEINDMLFKETLENWQFEEACKPDYFKCNNGMCVYGEYRCDGWADCKDGEDEHNCEDYECSVYSWKCTSPPKCINVFLRCDGIPGACNETTTEDEDNCQNNTCSDTYYRCKTGMCMPPYFVCDGYGECPDHDDELNCPVNKTMGNDTNGDSSMDNVTWSQPTTSPKPLTTLPTTSARIMNSTTEPLTTTDNSRRKREAPVRPWTDETNRKFSHLKERLQLYRNAAGNKSLVVDAKKDTFRDAKARWETMGGSENRESFIQELYDSYVAFQKSEILKKMQKTGNGHRESNENNQAHHRVKRQSRPLESVKNSTLAVNWTAVLQNSTFNKWNMLDNAAMTLNFYEERDDEYEAAMTYAYITAKLDSAFVEQSGHVKNDLIAACKFGGYQCSPANFTYFHSHKYGNCYTFNSKYANDTVLATRLPGPENGLRLELFLDQQNYVANLATEAGVRVLVHKKGSMPFPEDEGISVMPGRSTSVGIREVTFTRLPPPHGVCGQTGKTTDYYGTYIGTEYSKLACLKSCYQDLIMEHCKCAVPFYYILENVTVCNMTDRNIELCVTDLPKMHSESYEICDKMCPVPCTETRFQLSLSSAKWPSDKYQSYLIQRLGQTNTLYIQAQDSDSEFTKLQIYFEDLIYEHVEQQKAYESMNLISDLGGQLGLWLGLSAITIGEICSFLFGVGRSLSYKCWGNKTVPIQNDLTPITNIEPATLQEMYEEMCPEAAKYIPPDINTITLPGSTYA